MRIHFSVFLIFLSSISYAQLNTELVGRLDYGAELNDIWGYVAPDGTEYALVGVTDGVSIVSLADPADPQQVAFVPGEFSIWRDLKTYGDFAYVTTDQSGTREGLLVIDLRELPDRVSSFNWRPAPNGRDTLNRCHNIYIDEEGVAYLAGCNLNNGGMLFVDVASSPGQPSFINFAPPVYAHDVFVQDDRMFASEIYLGQMAIYDVSDKDSVRLLASQPTPFLFTHNAWSSPDGRYVFTTDERPNAPVAAYDISNLDNIRALDQYRPAATIGQGVVPHNVYTKDNFVLIAHYTDGARILDAGRPENLVEVANYDTYPGTETGFHGAWGVYPYLPSGHLLVSDIENGLFVLRVDYQRAGYLEGRVTTAGSGVAVRDVEVEIIADQPNIETTDGMGNYQTGLAQSGSYQVTFRHPEYLPKTIDVDIRQGEVTRLDVTLQRKDQYVVSGLTIDNNSQNPVAGVQILVANEDFSYQVFSDENGRFRLEEVFEGGYDIFAGIWGYRHRKLGAVQIEDNASLTITLQPGYQDDFLFDLGWSTEGDAEAGQWERGVPDAVRVAADFVTPNFDIGDDLGGQCYATGLAGGSAGADDVDDGTVRLISPYFDLNDYTAPELSYYTWFFNAFGGTAPNDALRIFLTNGQDTILLEEITDSRTGWRPQSTFLLNGLIEFSDRMQLIAETSDFNDSGHVVEAAFDAFLVQDAALTDVNDPIAEGIELELYPNPFADLFTVRYDLKDTRNGRGFLYVFNTLGQSIQQVPLDAPEGTLEIGNTWQNGVYFILVEWNGKRGRPVKVMKKD